LSAIHILSYLNALKAGLTTVAKKGGEARAEDKESLSEAGRKGGQH
jgi:general stress protein YciG